MANVTDCERFIIEKLISILTKSLNCQSDSTSGSVSGNSGSKGVDSLQSEQTVTHKLLRILLSQNESDKIFWDNSNQESDLENSTDAVILYSDDSSYFGGPTSSNGISVTFPGSNTATAADDAAGSIGTVTNRLHKLEIIKVFVLIFVISIILLTTCRMVFQLFIKFRPEKSPLA